MRRHFTKGISILIAAIILFASNGFVISIGTCSMLKKSHVSFFAQQNCCSKKEVGCGASTQAAFEGKCCKLSMSYYKLNNPSPARNYFAGVSHFHLFALSFIYNFFT